MFSFIKKNAAANWNDWRWQLCETIDSPEKIREYLNLSPEELAEIIEVHKKFPLKISLYYLSLAQSKSLQDPILRQCIPSLQEIEQDNGSLDALGEENSSPVPCLVHRYPDRALFISTNYCSTHCRHCMRKRRWNADITSKEELYKAAEYIAQTSEIREVLISGGDPLLLPEEKLSEIIEVFSSLDNIEILRIGSRLPVVLPQRFTKDFCQLLAKSKKPIWLATHFNHPQELTAEAAQAIDNLLKQGIPCINQTVLLKGVNDDAQILAKLFTGLLKIKVKPYYLFHGDPISSAMHFRTGVEKGLQIMDELRGRVSGLALPAFAIDLPNGKGKIRLEPDTVLEKDDKGNAYYKNYQGEKVYYF